jgi:hypothetical protein
MEGIEQAKVPFRSAQSASNQTDPWKQPALQASLFVNEFPVPQEVDRMTRAKKLVGKRYAVSRQPADAGIRVVFADNKNSHLAR